MHRQEVPRLAIIEQLDAAHDLRSRAVTLSRPIGESRATFCPGFCAVVFVAGVVEWWEGKCSLPLYCTNWKESGFCDDGRMYDSDEIETRVVGGLQKHLRDPAAISLFIKTYTAERKRLAGTRSANRAELERKLSKVEGELRRTVRAMVESSAPIAYFNAELDRLGAEKKRLEAELANIAQPIKVVSLSQGGCAVSQEHCGLGRHACDGVPNGDAAGVIRELVASVTITPAAKEASPVWRCKGKLEALIGPERDRSPCRRK
jgi:hypothetical protein